MARRAWAETAGDRITIHNVRNCDYRSETEYTNCWSDRTYNLSDLRGADFFFVNWGVRWIGPLAFSIEARYKAGQTYSAILGFFRQYELIFNAADERDVRWRIADLALQQCSGQGPAGKVEASGFNDPAIAFHKNIFGLPAFRHNEIADAIPQTFLSLHFTLNPPPRSVRSLNSQ